jgi:hypothetical protein
VAVRALTPSEKGAIAEAKICAAAVEAGIVVSRPISEGRRYDMIFDVGPRLLRVQCKWTPRSGGVVVLRARTSRFTPAGYVHTTYRSCEIDGIAAYCPELDTCFYVPIEDVAGRSVIHLRLSPAKNNQRTGVTMAAAYRLGAIAQLGERRTGSAKVAGSSPASST